MLSPWPENFPNERLVTFPCVRVLKLSFPVQEFASAVRKGEFEPEIPAFRPLHLVVSRRDYIVRRSEIARIEFRLLQAIIDRSTIDEAIRTAAEDATDEQFESLAGRIGSWFQSWSASQFFSRIEPLL